MRRRELMLLLGGAMTGSRALRAQQKPMPVIGYLPSGRHSPFNPFAAAFRQGLSETGYVEGQNVVIEYRQGEGRYDRLPALAADLVGRKVDVIAAFSIPSALAAKNATSTIPIVFSTRSPRRPREGRLLMHEWSRRYGPAYPTFPPGFSCRRGPSSCFWAGGAISIAPLLMP